MKISKKYLFFFWIYKWNRALLKQNGTIKIYVGDTQYSTIVCQRYLLSYIDVLSGTTLEHISAGDILKRILPSLLKTILYT